jgi:hypothetical protein
MSNLFRDGHVNAGILPGGGHNLVCDYSEEDMHIVHCIFPEDQWPTGIPYPKLVALIRHIDEPRAVEKAIAMVHAAQRLVTRVMRLKDVVDIYLTAQDDSSISPDTWNEVVDGFDEEDLEPVLKLFPRNSWPPEILGVPHPNLVALAHCNGEKRAVQADLLAVVLVDIFGRSDMLETLDSTVRE